MIVEGLVVSQLEALRSLFEGHAPIFVVHVLDTVAPVGRLIPVHALGVSLVGVAAVVSIEASTHGVAFVLFEHVFGLLHEVLHFPARRTVV